MKSVKLMLVMAMAVMFVAAAPVWAEHDGQCSRGGKECSKGHDCGKEGGCPIVSKILKKAEFYIDNAKEIGLSDTQVEQIKTIKHAVKKDEILGGAQMQIAMLDMESMMKTDPVDVEGMNELVNTSSAQFAAGAKKSIQAYADLKAVLTEDQKAAAKKVWAQKKN